MDMLMFKHKGLMFAEDGETVYYYTDDMLKNNVIFEWDTIIIQNGDDIEMETYISVSHYNDIDAQEWHIYWGVTLHHIQVYRMIMDVYEMYRELPMDAFLAAVRDISGGGITAAMQSKPKHGKEIMHDIKTKINKFKVSS